MTAPAARLGPDAGRRGRNGSPDGARRLLSAWLPAALRAQCPPPLAAMLLARPEDAGYGERVRADWGAAFSRAHAQGIAPLLWASVERWGLGSDLGERAGSFAAAHGATLRQNVLHLAELVRITRELARREIQTVLLKGAAFVNGLYAHPAMRPMADLDLLVRPGDAARAIQTLRSLGYHELRPGLAAALLETNHEIELARRLPDGTRLYVELHWRLLPLESLVAGPAVEPDGLWARARPCEDPQIAARVMAPEDALLFSALHLQRHAYSRAIWFVDLALIIERSTLDWDRLLREAKAFDALGALYAALEGTAALCGVSAPPRVMRALRPGPTRRLVLGTILRWDRMLDESAARGEHALPPRRRYLLKLLQARDTLAALGRVARIIHPSEAWLRARYGIDRGALPAGLRRRHLAAAFRAGVGLADTTPASSLPRGLTGTATAD